MDACATTVGQGLLPSMVKPVFKKLNAKSLSHFFKKKKSSLGYLNLLEEVFKGFRAWSYYWFLSVVFPKGTAPRKG